MKTLRFFQFNYFLKKKFSDLDKFIFNSFPIQTNLFMTSCRELQDDFFVNLASVREWLVGGREGEDRLGILVG